MLAKLKIILSDIKIQHTVFALPFAVMSAFLAADGLPEWETLGWILIAMFGARNSAMAFNRIVDAKLDARNPRTQSRALPAGEVTVGQYIFFLLISSALLVWASGWKARATGAVAFLALLPLIPVESVTKSRQLIAFAIGACALLPGRGAPAGPIWPIRLVQLQLSVLYAVNALAKLTPEYMSGEVLTGISSIINTSFNMHEEPIVCSPHDAIRAFQRGRLDYLAIGDFVVASQQRQSAAGSDKGSRQVPA